MSKIQYRASSQRACTEKANKVLDILESRYTAEPQFLSWKNAFELMVAVSLSAQTTDLQVNRITPALFSRFPDPESLAAGSQEEVEALVHASGFYRVKARNIRAAAQYLLDKHGGNVPASMDELVLIPGLGRKSAGVVLHHIHGIPAIIVDTHFGRVCRRLGLSSYEDPVRLEKDIAAILDSSRWGSFSMRINMFGRDICKARKPECTHCVLAKLCPSRMAPVPFTEVP